MKFKFQWSQSFIRTWPCIISMLSICWFCTTIAKLRQSPSDVQKLEDIVQPCAENLPTLDLEDTLIPIV